VLNQVFPPTNRAARTDRAAYPRSMRLLVACAAIAFVGLASAASCASPARCRTTADCPADVACVYPIGDCSGVGRCEGIDGATTCRAPLIPLCACDGGYTYEYCDDPVGYTRAPAKSGDPCLPPPPAYKDPCTSDDDCGATGAPCLFAVADGCAAVGHCMTTAAVCPSAPAACACDGTTLRLNGCFPKLAAKPIRTLLPCEDAGPAVGDAATDAPD